LSRESRGNAPSRIAGALRVLSKGRPMLLRRLLILSGRLDGFVEYESADVSAAMSQVPPVWL